VRSATGTHPLGAPEIALLAVAAQRRLGQLEADDLARKVAAVAGGGRAVIRRRRSCGAGHHRWRGRRRVDRAGGTARRHLGHRISRALLRRGVVVAVVVARAAHKSRAHHAALATESGLKLAQRPLGLGLTLAERG
jgi:hypothetical protein